MPTPEVLRTGEADPFAKTPAQERSNRIAVAYATNRLPTGNRENRSYLTLFDQKLRLGVAWIQIGEGQMNWDDLQRLSTAPERDASIALDLESAREMALIGNDETKSLPAGAKAFFAAIDQALSASLDKDLTIYVHGANSNFYRATAQAAQYRHFTGRNSVVLSFAWPSAESILRYAVDVNNARRSVDAFTRLLELLSAHTEARRIDILAYSAGAQILGPALAALHRKGAQEGAQRLKERLRLGEIYFAAPDVDLPGFVADLAGYVDLADHITLAVNPNDSVLAFAASHHKVSRAGRPDPNELSAEETRWIQQATRHLPLDVIWVTSNEIPHLSKGAHDFWYSDPWVSTDVLLQFLFNARPADRGLAKYDETEAARVWYFPSDYPEKVGRATQALEQRSGLTLPPP